MERILTLATNNVIEQTTYSQIKRKSSDFVSKQMILIYLRRMKKLYKNQHQILSTHKTFMETLPFTLQFRANQKMGYRNC